jgi:RNA polymerase sigma factor (sigma-70 family)
MYITEIKIAGEGTQIEIATPYMDALKTSILDSEVLDSEEKEKILKALPDSEEITDKNTLIEALGYSNAPNYPPYIPKERMASMNNDGFATFIYLHTLFGVDMGQILEETEFNWPLETIKPLAVKLRDANIPIEIAFAFHQDLLEKTLEGIDDILEEEQRIKPYDLELKNILAELYKRRDDHVIGKSTQMLLLDTLFKIRTSLRPKENTKNAIDEVTNQLLIHNIRLVKYTVQKMEASQKISPAQEEDCITVGVKALAYSIWGFDPRKGIQFSTYAVKSIENAILRESNKNQDGLRVSPDILDLVTVYFAKEEELWGLNKSTHIKQEEIIHNLNAPKGQKDRIILALNAHQPFHILTDLDEDRMPEARQLPEDAVIQRETLSEIFNLAKDILTSREYGIFVQRFLGYSQKDIGKEFKITHQRVAQLEKKITKKFLEKRNLFSNVV